MWKSWRGFEASGLAMIRSHSGIRMVSSLLAEFRFLTVSVIYSLSRRFPEPVNILISQYHPVKMIVMNPSVNFYINLFSAPCMSHSNILHDGSLIGHQTANNELHEKIIQKDTISN